MCGSLCHFESVCSKGLVECSLAESWWRQGTWQWLVFSRAMMACMTAAEGTFTLESGYAYGVLYLQMTSLMGEAGVWG